MKNQLMAAAAILAILTATGASHAQTADVAALKQEAAALKKQNEALEQRLNKLEKQQAARASVQTQAPAAGPDAFLAQAAGAPATLLTGEGPLTWKGITLFGTVDAGLGWVSHGLPENGQNYEGQSVINKFTNQARFGVAQNGLSQTTLGIKGSEEILPGVSGVFMASTGINPQSGQLANMPGTLVANQGLNRSSYSFVGDGGRGGQAFNDQLYAGLASPIYGQLTFGRHKPFSQELMSAYDPAGGAYNYSVIGFAGAYVQGLGNTENARWDDSLKYRVEYGPVRGGLMYKFADGNGGGNSGLGGAVCPVSGTQPAGCTKSGYAGTTYYASKNDAGQLDLGGSYGGFDIDGVLGYFHQSVGIANGNSPLSATQLAGYSAFTSNTGVATNSIGNINSNTLQAGVADTTGGAIGAKYTYNQFKFYGGWSHVIFHNPADNVGIGADNDQGGYVLSQVNNAPYHQARLLDTFWTGVKYAYDPKTDITLSYYHVLQNQYGTAAQIATCTAPTQNAKAAQCSGTLDAVSLYVDHHFTKRFDVYAGMMVSNVEGGLAGGTLASGQTKITGANLGYNYYTNWAPTAGVRYTF
jgi:predicted porin